MRKFKNLLTKTVAVLSGGLLFIMAPAATAAGSMGYSLFGEASTEPTGNGSPTSIKLVSDDDPGFGGADFTIPDDLTLADLQTLSADYDVTDDDCAGGSPRFQVNLDTDNNGTSDGNAFVYLGPSPSYTDCETGWQSSGNLADDADFVDTTQLGGTFYDTFSNARATWGTADVLGVQVVVDSGWAFEDNEQTVFIDNVVIGSEQSVTFESKESCKNGGWQHYTDAPGPFKNQGQCVSHFARLQDQE